MVHDLDWYQEIVIVNLFDIFPSHNDWLLLGRFLQVEFSITECLDFIVADSIGASAKPRSTTLNIWWCLMLPQMNETFSFAKKYTNRFIHEHTNEQTMLHVSQRERERLHCLDQPTSLITFVRTLDHIFKKSRQSSE